MPAYSHWLAMELLQVVESARSQLDPPSETTIMEFTVGGQEMKIDKAHLILAHESIKKACELPLLATIRAREDTPVRGVLCETALASSELAFSALTVCHLDRFLFWGDNAHLGYCLHQGPTRKRPKIPGSPEAPDIYVCSCDEKSYGFPVAVGDVKLHDLNWATAETALYCYTSATVHSGVPGHPIYIGVPCSRSWLELQLYMEGTGDKMWQIPVYDDFPYCKELLCSLFCGIHFLIKSYYCNRSPMEKPLPLYGRNLVPLTNKDNCRSYLEESSQTVFKFFYQPSGSKPQTNIELLRSLDIFAAEKLDLEEVTSNCHMLKYGYIKGVHKPNKLHQFSGAVHDLSKLHTAGFVHGDIRLQNIVFQKDTSHLIDYDLASKEGSRYPVGYNHSLDGRHVNAMANYEMFRTHDRHSMLFFMNGVAKTQAELEIVEGMGNGMELMQVAVKLETLGSRKRA